VLILENGSNRKIKRESAPIIKDIRTRIKITENVEIERRSERRKTKINTIN